VEQAVQTVRIIIPTEKVPNPAGHSGAGSQASEKQEAEWHGIGILYARRVEEAVELRLFYEAPISQRAKDEIGHRFGIGAIEWEG
jgi:hypothetical protein